MTRLLILATIILSIVSYASAQVIEALNTPLGPVTQGANVAVSWTLLAGVDATGKNGDLSATDSTTKNTIPIDPAVPLAPKTYMWQVKVPPGTYVLGLNDGSGLKQSGEVVVKAPAGGALPPAAPGKAPAPAPAPAPGTPAPGTPAPAPAPGTSPSPSSGTPDTAPPPAGSPSTSTPGGATSPAPAAAASASSIFSGYQVVFSLLGVAVAMVHF